MKWLILFIAIALAMPVSANWISVEIKDRMTGDIQAARAASLPVKSDIPLPFPYEDVTGTLIFETDGINSHVYVLFDKLVLEGGKDQAEYNDYGEVVGYHKEYMYRVKWDDDVTTHPMLQFSNKNVLFFKFQDMAFKYLKECKTVMVEVIWHDQGRVIFEFNLTGSTKAIEEAINIMKGIRQN